MDLGLGGRVVIVTGASSGIGLDTCRLLVEEGADVVACARRETILDAAVGELPTKNMLAIADDVNDQADMNAVVDAAMRRFGRLDGLTNIVRAARRQLSTRRGRIVTITAPAGRDPELSMAAVSAGRAAIASLTRSLASDFAHEGIAVNAVSVSLIDTPRQQPGIKRRTARREVATLITLALSPVLGYTTGSTFSATGGLAAG